MSFPQTVIDTVFKALAPAIPDRTIAGHHADLVIQVQGITPEGNFFIVSISARSAAAGVRNEDGVSVTVCINDGDTHNTPSEQVEAKFPADRALCASTRQWRRGRMRGGLGAEMVVQARSPFALTTRIDRMHCKPWGLHGGDEAEGNGIGIRRGGAWETELPNAKIFGVRLRRGDAYMMRSGGGGGFGSPLERDPEQVAFDVREGYVSAAVALNVYRVVLTAGGEVDVAATQARRRASARARRGRGFQTIPG